MKNWYRLWINCILRGVEISSSMNKFGSVYRRKGGNCNKPFRRFHDSWDAEQGYSGIPGNTSRNVNLRNSDYSEGRKFGNQYGHQNPYNTSTFGKEYKGDKGFFKPPPHDNKSYSTINTPRFEGPIPESSNRDESNRKSRKIPPGLKGKEIGLWFRDQNKNKNLEKEQAKMVEVFLHPETQSFIEEVLRKTEASGYNNTKELLNIGEDSNTGKVPLTLEEKIKTTLVTPLTRDPEEDMKLYNEFKEKQKNPDYMRMAAERESLPAFEMKDKIIDLIDQNQVIIVSGGTGCGKTTQIVQYVLDHYIMNMKGSLCNIICTQPRRISAITVAGRVASERAETIGDSIGYQIRLENMLAARTVGCINFMTTGVLLTTLQFQLILDRVSHLFLDEVHERAIDSDLMMALLKYILPKRPNLKVILMSATVNESSFSAYFSGAPIIEIPGITYPVEEIFLEDILQKINYNFEVTKKQSKDPVFLQYILPYVRDIEQRGLYSRSVITQLKNPNSEALSIPLTLLVVEYICFNEEDGAILVFLPGLSDINTMQNMIFDSPWYSPARFRVIPMHSTLPSINQKEAFEVPPAGVRKIILATSILETSVTVNDVCYVVDCGKQKFSGFDIKKKVATLIPSWITLANAIQRQGRAGRTRSGKCYKLYTKVRQNIFDQFPLPESMTTSMEEVILKAKMLKVGSVAPFLLELMDPPSPEIVELSLKMLRNMNVLDSDERLTPLGFHLAMLPVHPRTGKMILMAALFGCVDPIFSIVACLSFKDPFIVQLGKEKEMLAVKEYFADGEKSDHFLYSEASRLWEESENMGCGATFAYEHFLSLHTIRLISEIKQQFAKTLHAMNFLASPDVRDPTSNVNSNNRALVKAIVCAGLYPNVAILKLNSKSKTTHLLKTADHSRVLFHLKSYLNEIPVFESPFFVYHIILKSSSIFIHDATMVHPMSLLFFGERLDIMEKDGIHVLRIDENIKFKSNKKTGELVKSLRKLLDRILEKAILNPEEFKWDYEDGKKEILSAIIKLLSSESMTQDGRSGQIQMVQYTSRA